MPICWIRVGETLVLRVQHESPDRLPLTALRQSYLGARRVWASPFSGVQGPRALPQKMATASSSKQRTIGNFEAKRVGCRLDARRTSVLEPNQHSPSIQAFLRDLIATSEGNNHFIDRHLELSRRYYLGESGALKHPLVDSTAPEIEL